MFLTVNIGNTNISFGVFDGGQIANHGRVPIKEAQLLTTHIGDARFNRIGMASVAPSLTDRMITMLAMHYNSPVLLTGRDLPYGIETQYDDPATIGADRLLNAIAAFARTNSTTIVADVGTAVTVDLVSNRGTFCGGTIAPGPGTMLRSLHDRTELLPDVDLEEAPSPVGHSTADAIQSGVFWGTVGMVESLVSRITAERSDPARVLVTGGSGEWVAREMSGDVEFAPTLTLEGIAILLSKSA